MKKRVPHGFTLIELLVVIAIIGYLSVIGIVQLNGAREQARDARRKSDFAELRLGLLLYQEENGRYPSPVSNGSNGPDLSGAADPSNTIFDDDELDNPIVKEYMVGRFIDPVNSASLYYSYDTNNILHTEYRLCTILEGGSVIGQYLVMESTGELSVQGSCNAL